MQDRDLYGQILEIVHPWQVVRVVIDRSGREVSVFAERAARPSLRCPTCERPCRRYDTRERRWRHLDTCQYRTILVAAVPRVKCKEHGVLQVPLPWAEPGSRFTALFEAMVISWLAEACTSAVARQMDLSWDEVDGIMQRAVNRGLARRKRIPPKAIAVDETSFKKRHEYVTIVSSGGVVAYVADGKKKSSLDGFYSDIGKDACRDIAEVTMDMSDAFISSTREHVPNADAKIIFDRFHVAKALGEAVDKTRRAETKQLLADGDDSLKGTRYFWLENPCRMRPDRWLSFEALRKSSLRTAQAWALKEAAMNLWEYKRRGWAEKAWKQWIAWAHESGLTEMKKVAETILRHWDGVMNATLSTSSNAIAESINSRIQHVKRMARGFRNRKRFRMAIYFHLGGLDLMPGSLTSNHSIS
jgi:transposase